MAMEENKRNRRKRNSNELNPVQTKRSRNSQDSNNTLIEVFFFVQSIIIYILYTLTIGSKMIMKL